MVILIMVIAFGSDDAVKASYFLWVVVIHEGFSAVIFNILSVDPQLCTRTVVKDG